MGIVANKLAEEARDKKAAAYDAIQENAKAKQIAKAGYDGGRQQMLSDISAYANYNNVTANQNVAQNDWAEFAERANRGGETIYEQYPNETAGLANYYSPGSEVASAEPKQTIPNHWR